VCLGITNFVDIQGKYHVCSWQGRSLYQVDTNTGFWDVVGNASPANLQQNTVRYRAFANNLWWTSISQPIGGPVPNLVGGGGQPPGGGATIPFLAYWDGLAAAPVYQQTLYDASVSNSVAAIAAASSPTVSGSLNQFYPQIPGGLVGPLNLGAQFLAELNNQLLLANVMMEDQNTGLLYNLPNILWWSANGLPLQWDPTQNTSAGFDVFFDVSDLITGLMTLGVAGYIFRSYGITQFAPTGSATAPFQFNHMWASEHGVGNVLAWSVAQYGQQGAFVAQDNIYALTLTNATTIGGKSRDAIMTDISNMMPGAPFAPGVPYGALTPIFKGGYVYLIYQLLIPFSDHVRLWVYSFEDNNWSPWDLAIGNNLILVPTIYCPPNVV